MRLLIDLFWTFLKIGAFSFGGGYAMLPLIEQEIVQHHGWLTQTEFLDIIGISQATPGPIAINSATFVGFKTAGVWGALWASLGVVLVSFLLVLTASHFMKKFKNSKLLAHALTGMRPALVALIFSAAVSAGATAYTPLDPRSLGIGVLILGLLYKTKIHPILLIALSAGLGLLLFGLFP
ncbi:Chromate transport protein [Clostridiaceae bacterium JG1575]|nr:Chromate transport protein [Clostridiaceae bacterium JG1575]